MSSLERFNYAEQDRRLVAACDWLESIGVTLNKTRVAEYRQIVVDIAEYHALGEIDQLIRARSLPRLVNAIIQASEFIDIHVGLRGLSQTEELTNRLRDFVGGCAMLTDETANANRPRNIGFELLIAASAARGGLPIDLLPPADVSIPTEPYPFFVECKRPFRENKFQNHLRKALNQLVKRYEEYDRPSDARGFVALSISKLVNDGSYILRVPNQAALDVEVDRVFNHWIGKHRRLWETGQDSRTVAVLLELRTACEVKELSLLGVGRFLAMIGQPGSIERDQFEPVAEAFRRAGDPV